MTAPRDPAPTPPRDPGPTGLGHGLTGAGALVAALASYGVDTVFGIPGTHNLALYQELGKAGIRCVTPRHEQGAGYAADGYARACGRPGVAVTTTGPAAVNAATALAQAYSDSVPVLLVSPGVPSSHPRQGRGYLHESKDQSRALDALCAWSHRVTSVAEIPAAVARAFALFREGRPRPVHIEIPVDLLDAEGPAGLGPPLRLLRRAPDPAALDAAATALGTARRPAVVLGGGCHPPAPDHPRPPEHARTDGHPSARTDGPRTAARTDGPHPAARTRSPGELAVELAELLGAPIVTTANGKGAVPESHPLSLGATLHLAAVREWLAGCDVVLAAGTELAPSDLWVDDFRLGGTLIRVDVDPGQMHGDHVADVPVVGDAGEALRGLLERLAPAHVAASKPGPGLWHARDAELEALTRRWAGHLAALRDALPAETIVAADNSMMCYYGALGGLPTDPPGRFLFPTGYGTLGFALPAGIGAAVARPGTPVAVLAGDGAFQFSLQELATAVELGLSLPIVVSVNGGYGEIRAEMAERGMPPVAVDLHAPDFVLLARAYGARGLAAGTPGELREAVREAVRAPVPTVIVVKESQ
ncbi:thiamine pyrophosphate-binding protein [Sphaerisporangium sp. NBC_01403]|uniref:thiamine pyrophosphate-binding protein n=1 Tax=Sphaerisporangium sp. NBC_01403 TaxID=2903599 RepID=UPI003254C8CF